VQGELQAVQFSLGCTEIQLKSFEFERIYCIYFELANFKSY